MNSAALAWLCSRWLLPTATSPRPLAHGHLPISPRPQPIFSQCSRWLRSARECTAGWGGSWIDVDDLCVRPVPPEQNVIGAIEWTQRTTMNSTYFGHRFERLIPPEWVSTTHELAHVGGLHIGNDPMINWRPGNRFLATWLRAIAAAGAASRNAYDWGQVIPTALLSGSDGEAWLRSGDVHLQGQHYMLLHPAYACRPSCLQKGFEPLLD